MAIAQPLTKHVSKNGELKLEIGNVETTIEKEAIINSNWHNLDLKVGIAYSSDNINDTAKRIIIQLNSSIMTFFELKTELLVDSELGLPEGARKKVTVNKYERSRKNRDMCISEHGTNCQICNFSFESFYGSIGWGYIHVHHLTPVSKMGGRYKVDPRKDLIPVCPNCHSMLHKREPPITPEELQQMVEEASGHPGP